MTFAEYDHLGGLEGAIAKRADEALESLPQSAQAAAPRVLRALATLGGDGNDTPVARSVPLNSFRAGNGRAGGRRRVCRGPAAGCLERG